MHIINRIVWLTLISMLSPIGLACIDTDCLPLIEANTRSSSNTITSVDNKVEDIQLKANNELTYWELFLKNYLHANYDPNTLTPLSPFIEQTPGIDTSAFNTLNQTKTVAATSAAEDTQLLINKILTNDVNLSNMMNNDFSDINPYGGTTTASGGLFGSETTTQNNNASLNIESLLGTTSIAGLNSNNKSAENGLPATNLIKLISGAVIPNDIDQAIGNRTNEEWRNYLARIWSMQAKLSLVLGNFYNMLRHREGGSQSPAALEAHHANKRLDDPNWFDDMQTASPIRLQREIVFLLAEMQRTQHLIQQQDERILATLSAVLAQGVETGREMMNLAEEVQKSIDEAQSVEIPDSTDIPDLNDINI